MRVPAGVEMAGAPAGNVEAGRPLVLVTIVILAAALLANAIVEDQNNSTSMSPLIAVCHKTKKSPKTNRKMFEAGDGRLRSLPATGRSWNQA